MQFGRFDFAILVGMSLAIIFMSFTFPALGIGGDEVTESDIPDFNITAERFDWTGEFPERPFNPTQGTLEYVDNQEVNQDNRRVWLQGDSTDGFELTLTNGGTLADPDADLFFNNYTGGTSLSDSITLTDEGDFGTIENFSYVIAFSNVQFENEGEANMTMTVDWEIEEQPSDDAGIIASVWETTTGGVGYIGTIIWWISATIVTTVLNILGIMFDIATFGIDFVVWLTTTYSDIISSQTTGWVSVMVAVPGIIISLEFVKTGMILIKLLPFT